MTLGSLFDGSGGFSLAGLLNGIEPKWSSEVEPFCIRVTSKRLPTVKHYGDVSTLSGRDLAPVDIITFGSPCQDLSIAGRRAGLEDGERSNLFYQAVRIIKEMRNVTNGRYPRYAVWENVPGALTSNKGEDFRSVLESLCQVKSHDYVPRPQKWGGSGYIMGDGYSVAWRTLDAQYWGVPQRRRRIFLVADFDGASARKILFESESLPRNLSKGRTPWTCPTASVERGSGMESRLYENHAQDSRIRELGGVSETVAQKYGTGGNNVPIVLQTFSQETYTKYAENDVSPTLACKGRVISGGGETLVVSGYGISQFGQYVDSGVCGTLRSVGKDLGGGGEMVVVSKRRTSNRHSDGEFLQEGIQRRPRDSDGRLSRNQEGVTWNIQSAD